MEGRIRLVTARTLHNLAARYPHALSAVANWIGMVESANWTCANDAVVASTVPVRAIPNKRLVFNLKGNDFRLICSVRYADPSCGHGGVVRVEFFGTHAEYDKVDATTVRHDPSTPEQR